MSKQKQRGQIGRRDFIQGSAITAGAAALLAAGSGAAIAQAPPAPNAPPPAGPPPGGGGRPRGDAVLGTPLLPASASCRSSRTSRARPVHHRGNTGIGLGIARAAANAGMNVVMGYIQDNQVEPALALFKSDQKAPRHRHPPRRH